MCFFRFARFTLINYLFISVWVFSAKPNYYYTFFKMNIQIQELYKMNYTRFSTMNALIDLSIRALYR